MAAFSSNPTPEEILEQAQSLRWETGGSFHEKLMEARLQLMMAAARDTRLTRVRPNGMADAPQYKVDIDWEKAGALGVPVTAIQNAISAAFGSACLDYGHVGLDGYRERL